MNTVEEAVAEAFRLSRKLDQGLEFLREQAVACAETEAAYREAKATAWLKCPNDPHSVKAGEREWTAARREAWVNAETAQLRKARDMAENMRQAAIESVRSRRQQISLFQSLLARDRAEAEFVRTGPMGAAA